jgi:hypothetical protein
MGAQMADFILRHRRKSNFTLLPNEVVRDARITFKALGLLVFLLSLPGNWKLNLVHLSNLRAGRGNRLDSIKSALAELQQTGYLEIKRIRVNGRYVGSEWIVTDSPDSLVNQEPAPQVDFPLMENPRMDSPHVGNPLLQKKSSTKTDCLNKQLPQEGDGSGCVDLIFPFLRVEEIEILRELVCDCPRQTAQDVLDEIEGCRRAGQIKVGPIPLAQSLIRSLNAGKFQISKGVAVQAERAADARRIAELQEFINKDKPPANAQVKDCPANRVAQRARQKQASHAATPN